MKKPQILLLILPFTGILVSCSFGFANSTESQNSTSEGPVEVNCNVYKYVDLPAMEGTITYSYEGLDIEVDEAANKVCGTLANTSTKLTMSNGSTTQEVTVNVVNRAYSSKHAATESSEGWFDDVTITPISGISASFAGGTDVSSCKHLYDAGQKFYNASGVEESLFRILKDNGVNWVRFRLWNDPYNHNFLDAEGNPTAYGGGVCDLDNVTWMSSEAKRYGLKVLLDFHYSDFWADPTNQVIPKAWASYTTSDQMASAISTYTTSVLQHLKDNQATPDMVAVGNENIKGLLMQLPGADSNGYTSGDPDYINKCTNASSAISGGLFSDNLTKYLKAGVDAVKAFDTSILTMIHMAKGLSKYDYIISIYNCFSTIDYDVIGLSGYAYWHFGSMSVLKTGLSAISAAFPQKKIALAETAYGFTYEEDPACANMFSTTSSTTKAVSGYSVDVQGQASILRDTMNVVSSLPNGFGCFYWEAAWTATPFCGWGDFQSSVSWANQSLFSYNGKALGSLAVYSKIRGQS